MTGAAGSIVIPAHDEAAVLGRCLATLAPLVERRGTRVVVSANGCMDATAEVARSFAWALVLETDRASKTAALNLADDVAETFPRLYVDADIVLPPGSAEAVIDRLATGPALAARPRYVNQPAGATAVVRSYYRARARMTSVQGSLWGAGVYALSAEGRARFGAFPDVVADDLFVDRLFRRHEIDIVDVEPVVVYTPRDLPNLLNVLRRAQRGKGALTGWESSWDAGPGTGGTAGDLLRTGFAGPGAFVDATVYAALAAIARAGTRLPATPRWERDVSTRLG
jgi:glycosyltransferase involved in cell wall biosynthesis